MLTGQDLDDDYMSQLGAHVGATAVVGWMHAILHAMHEHKCREPSLLILDCFNSLGQDDFNLRFIKRLYGWDEC